MKVLDLFAGIGGFTLGLERAGFETVAFCEIDPFAQKVLNKNWPKVPIYDDVKEITAARLKADGIGVDIITGGFPCQDISVAGKQEGLKGERSGLWSECARLLGDIRPRYAIFENVRNLLNGNNGDWFRQVLWEISTIGYDVEWHCIPASALGAHHKRDRVWIVAYRNSDDRRGRSSAESYQRKTRLESRSSSTRQHIGKTSQTLANSSSERLQRSTEARDNGEDWTQPRHQFITGCSRVPWSEWETEPNVGRVANGVPDRTHRLKCLGNAVVPPIPEMIGRAIMQRENNL